jgi:hypothetical protein
MMLCQNEEYSPMYYRGRYGPAPSTGQSEIPAVFAPELTNRNPPFATAEVWVTCCGLCRVRSY